MMQVNAWKNYSQGGKSEGFDKEGRSNLLRIVDRGARVVWEVKHKIDMAENKGNMLLLSSSLLLLQWWWE